MFTGITRGTFEVVAVEREPGLLRYAVELGDYGVDLEVGASVSIDGVCQTVVIREGTVVRFDAIQETLDKTTLGGLEVGARVSVERSARVGDEIGGHDVSGHVRGTGRVAEVRRDGHEVKLVVAVPPEWMKYILTKGFIAVDGSSLTVGETEDEGRFSVYLIPETLRLTNLGKKRIDDRVNIELDPRTVAIVDTVERVLAQ
ncbi:MAG: riboflavin synthase subunit alpha, partial [Polyangiaceae bacterium]